MTAEAKALQTIEVELGFIARKSQEIEGSFNEVDEINFAVNSALRALHELKLERQDSSRCTEAGFLKAGHVEASHVKAGHRMATEEIPAGLQYPAAAA